MTKTTKEKEAKITNLDRVKLWYKAFRNDIKDLKNSKFYIAACNIEALIGKYEENEKLHMELYALKEENRILKGEQCERILLNRFENPTINECIFVKKGYKVFAKKSAEELGFTAGKEYEIKGLSFLGYCLIMENDKGEVEEYSVEHFQHQKLK